MPKKSRLRGSVEKQLGKCLQTIFKFGGQLLYHIYWSLWRKLSDKKSLLVIREIPNLFPITLSAEGKYSLLDRDNITQQIQMTLSIKQKKIAKFFSSIFKSSLKLEHF